MKSLLLLGLLMGMPGQKDSVVIFPSGGTCTNCSPEQLKAFAEILGETACHIDIYTCERGQVYRNHVFSGTMKGETDCKPVPSKAKRDPIAQHWYSEPIATPTWARCGCPSTYIGLMERN